jgi:insulysin
MPASSRVLLSFIGLFFLTACSLMPNQSTTDIIKSENDSRSYRSLTLQNQLEVIVISDPDTDKAAAALNVATGSGNDPDDYPGLAHFLEHMLFLGTEKYPEAGEYQSFISKHGGSHNAFTSFEDTNYFFEVDSDYLSPTLDRFAQFFISPLFSEEYVKREINAVHSEYQSKLRDDGRRQFDTLKAIINPAHPYSKFSTGSLETLSSQGKALSTREAMLNFYQTEYSANRMSLVILGKESLNQLEQLARELFSPVINRELKVKEVNQPLFTEGQLPGLLTIKPLKARHELKLQFPIPQSTPFYREKPTGYLVCFCVRADTGDQDVVRGHIAQIFSDQRFVEVIHQIRSDQQVLRRITKHAECQVADIMDGGYLLSEAKFLFRQYFLLLISP